jgi:hypothetical protein
MKKFIPFFILLFCNISLMAQEPATNVVNIVFPPGIEKLNDQQINNYIGQDVKKFWEINSMHQSHMDIYRIKGTVISLWSFTMPNKLKGSLASTKGDKIKAISSRYNIEYTKIVSVNNISYVVIKYVNAEHVCFGFYSEWLPVTDTTRVGFANGYLETTKDNEKNTEGTLLTILNGIHRK